MSGKSFGIYYFCHGDLLQKACGSEGVCSRAASRCAGAGPAAARPAPHHVGTLLHAQPFAATRQECQMSCVISEYYPYRVVTGSRSGREFYLRLSSDWHLHDNLKGRWLAEPQKSNAILSPTQSDLYKIQASVQN